MLIRGIIRVSEHQIFEIPTDFSLNVDKKANHFLSYGHINVYSPQTFRFLLKSEGLKIENYKNYLNEKEVYNFMNRKKSFIKKVKSRVKRILRKIIPFFMEFKPRVTIVRTLKED